MVISEKAIVRLGSSLFYIGGAVWILYAIAKYLLELDVTMRQFLPFHLGAVIPGVVLRRGAGTISRLLSKR